jgi:branched-chain amino acid transport system ATP-binding protein
LATDRRKPPAGAPAASTAADTARGLRGADEAILALEGVVSGYGPITILNGTTLTVRRNRITTLIGPNGAGKSTVFKAIFGLLRVTAGHILFDGEDITGCRPAQLLARGMTYVPQGRNVFPELTVRHNLELGGVTLHDRDLLATRIEAVLARFPVLREKAHHQCSTLSGGEQKLLEVGRALLLQPRLMLIDEPSIGLAPKVVASVFSTLQELRSGGVTILMVEQNARSALAVSDDALVLEQGALCLSGPAAQILASPHLRALFLGGTLEGDAVEGSPSAGDPRSDWPGAPA